MRRKKSDVTQKAADLPPVVIVAGPTAGGKSEAALTLADQHNGVIINADSLQIYEELPILTAQPPLEDIEAAPHRLYGFLAGDAQMSAGKWRARAVREIEAAHANGQLPIVCGGTGFYLKALIEGLSPIPDIPERIRTESQSLYDLLGKEAFFHELEKRDPVMAVRLNVNDKQRVIRAWEVLEATGRSLAAWQTLPKEGGGEYRFEIHLIMPERGRLMARCDRRFEMMLDAGAWDEVKMVSDKIDSGDYKENAPVTRALGFHELRSVLNGEMRKEEAVAKAQAVTRQYAKRQITWFRHQLPVKEAVKKLS